MFAKLRQVVLSPLGRTGFTLASANYLQAGVGLLIQFNLANVLGAEQFGFLSYGLIVGTFLYTLVNFGAERTLVRDLVQGEDRHALMSASLILRAGIGVSALMLIAVAAAVVDLDPYREQIVLLCCIAAVLWACWPVAWFDSRYRMDQQALITLGEKILYAVFLVIVFMSRSMLTAAWAAFGLALTRGLSLVTQLGIARCTWIPRRTELRRHVRWILRGNAYIVPAALASLLISYWNPLYLEHHFSAARLGYFALAFQMMGVVTLLQNQVVRLFFPRIAKLVAEGADLDLAARKLKLYPIYGWVLSLAVVVPLLLIAPWIVGRFFEPEYRHTLPPLRVLGAWAVFYGGARLINVFLVNLRLERQYLWCATGAGAVSVLAGLLLIPKYGEVGVALAMLISQPVCAAAEWVFIERELRSRRRRTLRLAADTEVP